MRSALLAACAAALAVLAPGPALASCAPAPPLEQAIAEAEAVFTGTVTALANSDRWATVAVDEVWKGDVAATVEVRGGPADPPGPIGLASSVDRTYELGVRYLFVSWRAKGDDVFLDNICTSTQEYSDELDAQRPPDAAPPGEPPAPEEPPGRGGSSRLSGTPVWSLPAALALGFCALLLVAVGLSARPR